MSDGFALGLAAAGLVGLAALVRGLVGRGGRGDDDVALGHERLAEAELYARAFEDSELQLDRRRALGLAAEAIAAFQRARDRSGYRDHDPAVQEALGRAMELQGVLAPELSSAEAPEVESSSAPSASSASTSDDPWGV